MNASKKIGSKIWVFPDAERPEKTDGKLKAHESIIILNLNKKIANILMSLYFENKPPLENIELEIEPLRVKCYRLNNPEDIGGVIIPKNTQYAIVLNSNIEIIAQYGRLDTTQPNMAFYTVIGYNG